MWDGDGASSSVSSATALDESGHRLQQHPPAFSTTIKYNQYDAVPDEEEESDYLTPGQTANGKDFTYIRVPEGAPTDLVCEECERRDSVAYCEVCEEVLCGVCLAITHLPGTGVQAHPHLVQGRIRILRTGDKSAVIREEEDPIPAYEIDEEEMATRRDLAVPTSLEAPSIDLVSRTSERNSAVALHTKGQLVVFDAAVADSLPDHLAYDDDDDEEIHDGHKHGPPSQRQALGPRELYGEVMSVPMARHGEWGNARRRMQGHRLLVRVKILGKASEGYDEPFVEEWLQRKHRREGPRESVEIVGGGGPDPLAQQISAAKVTDMRRDAVRRSLVPPEMELPLGRAGHFDKLSTTTFRAAGEGKSSHFGEVGMGTGVNNDSHQSYVVLVAEDQLIPVETKRKELARSRRAAVEACCKNAEKRREMERTRTAMKRWRDNAIMIGKERWEWASRVLQRRTRDTLARLRETRRREAEEKTLWEAGRKLHKQFRYLNTQELRDEAGGGVTTDGRVFLRTKAELNRLEALRRVMAERSFRMLSKGVYHVKVRAFKQWLRYTEWDRRENETYVFSVGRDTSLAGDEPVDAGPCKTDWKHPSHGIALSPLPRIYSGRVVNKDGQTDSREAFSAARRMAGPAPFCSWLMPGSVLMSSYIHPEAKARPRDFKQPLHPDAASQIMIAGIGTLVCLSSEEEIRRHETARDLPNIEQAFGVRHKTIAADIRVSMGEAKHEVTMLRQEEKNLELLRFVEGYDQDERRKGLADIVGRMRVARSAYTAAKRANDLFPRELRVAWEPLPEDEAPGVDELVKLASRLEDRLRAGEKLCLWSPRGHGRVGVVGAVLLGRLYGCTAEDALLRVQVCHDARESLRDQPQISCPQTIAQVQCVREALLQMSSIYTDLAMRADLPASNRGVKVCRSIRGQGPPCLRPSERVADETQADRYRREREQRRQIDTIQDDHQPDLLFSPSANATTTTRINQPSKQALFFLGNGVGELDALRDTRNEESRRIRSDGNDLPPARKLIALGDYRAGPGTGGENLLSLPPASNWKSSSNRPPMSRDRARAVAAVPYPTMRSLRKT